MPDDEKPIESAPKVTREAVRAALSCPVCRRAGTYLGETCSACGAHQKADGTFVVPEEVHKKPASNPWVHP
jgi:hypothetical protein